jgi:penicillin-binding protein 2
MLLPSARRPPREERPQSPQLTLRVAALGGVAVILFVVLFFRLWVLQVLSAERYQQAAVQNQLRTVRIAAPRGRILDENGHVLVDNRPGVAIAFDLGAEANVARRCARTAPAPRPYTKAELAALLGKLKGARRRARRATLIERRAQPPRVWAGCSAGAGGLLALSRLTRTPLATFEDRIHRGVLHDPFEPVVLIDDADEALAIYLKEHGADFAGLRVVKQSERYFPFHRLASQIFGQLGEVSPAELKQATAYPNAQAGDVVGKSGLEQAYDAWLRGRDGTLRVLVDALGVPQGQPAQEPAPLPGRNLRLTLDVDLQRAAQKAIQVGVEVAHHADPRPYPRAENGAVVVMDIHTGAIRAIASYPDVDLNSLVGRNGSDALARLYAQANRTGQPVPLYNRATLTGYAPGSTYKPVTAIAAIENHLVDASTPIPCPSRLIIDHQLFRNFEGESNAPLDLRNALSQSCDTYFYGLGLLLYKATDPQGRHQPQPEWAARLGFGQHTGIEIGDNAGTNPDAGFKKRKFDLPGKKPDLIRDKWTSGDAVQAAIGQGFVEVTPLQIASLYGLFANGGTLVTPHLGLDVEDGEGNVLRRLAFPPRSRVPIEPGLLAAIRDGLRGVTHDAGQDPGTAAQSFAGFPVGVAGKTGTAQKYHEDDYSWFVGYAPIDDPQLVAVAVIEQGGTGGLAAARAVRSVFAAAFHTSVRADGTYPQAVDLHNRPIPVDQQQVANARLWGDPTAPASAPDSIGGPGTAAGGATGATTAPATTTAVPGG